MRECTREGETCLKVRGRVEVPATAIIKSQTKNFKVSNTLLTSSQIEVDTNMQMKNPFTILLPNLQKSISKIYSYLLDYAKHNGKEKTLIGIDNEAGVDDILEDIGMW